MKLYVSVFASALLMLSLQAYAGQDMAQELCAAARSGNIEGVRSLLRAGASASEEFMSWTPMARATFGGHLGVVRLLLEHGASVNIGRCGFSTLGVAVARGCVDVARVLLEHGADIEHGYCHCRCLAGQGCTLKHKQMKQYFALHPDSDITKDSVDLGWVCAHLTDNCRQVSPLWLAVIGKNAAMARVLLQYGANIAPAGLLSKTLLDLAVCQEARVVRDLIQVLMEYEAPKPLKAYNLKSLFRAVMGVHGGAKLLRPFLEYGVPPTGEEKVIKEFIMDKISVYGMDGSIEACRELIGRGVDLEERWWYRELSELHEQRLRTVAECLNKARVPAPVAGIIAHMSGQSDEQVSRLHKLMR